MNNIYSFDGQEEIISPQLVYYPQIILENVREMKKIAGGAERLWPHIKTHKMAKVTEMLVEEGINKFKCATIAEAEMAIAAGAAKIVLAYPLVGPNIARYIAISKDHPEVVMYAIADDDEQVKLLSDAAAAAGMTVNLLVDMDMGQHRTGVLPENIPALYLAWDKLPGIHMSGMHCYDGHRHETDYSVRDGEVAKIDPVVESVKAELIAAGADCSVIVMGGTPSFPCHTARTGEYLSPGTCVIQDAGYRDAYPDLKFVPGAAILTRVVSRPTANTFTMDMGTKAVACDPAIPRAELVGMEYVTTVMQNEEHWVVQVPDEHIKDIPKIGTVMYAIPVHVCPTSALYPSVPVAVDGKHAGWWDVTARNRKITY